MMDGTQQHPETHSTDKREAVIEVRAPTLALRHVDGRDGLGPVTAMRCVAERNSQSSMSLRTARGAPSGAMGPSDASVLTYLFTTNRKYYSYILKL